MNPYRVQVSFQCFPTVMKEVAQYRKRRLESSEVKAIDLCCGSDVLWEE